MKESINEHDMTKKMMGIMRGGYKPLLNEFVNAPNLDTTQIEPEADSESENSQETQGVAKPPREGRAPLIQLDGSYFEMPKNDSRFTALQKALSDRVEQAEITSVYIADPKGLVINGVALDFSENSGLYFTLALSEDSVLISSENVQGKLSTEVQTNLQSFLDSLRANRMGTRQYEYNEQLDKDNKPDNE
jgi:hypothetical protein